MLVTGISRCWPVIQPLQTLPGARRAMAALPAGVSGGGAGAGRIFERNKHIRIWTSRTSSIVGPRNRVCLFGEADDEIARHPRICGSWRHGCVRFSRRLLFGGVAAVSSVEDTIGPRIETPGQVQIGISLVDLAMLRDQRGRPCSVGVLVV